MASDSTIALQTMNRMLDRLSAEKQNRRIEALKMVELGLKDRQMTMMEEMRGLQADQSRMQMAMIKVADMEKFTNVQKAKIANDFLTSSRFLDFYNPDNPEWAVEFTKALKGEYKEGMFGDEQGWKFSDRNASLIASSLIQAQAGNPDAVLTLIDRANRAYLTAQGGKALQAEDANLLTGFTNMGMFMVGQDAEGNPFVEKSPQWQSLTDATTNVLSNESMIRKERVDIQTGDYDITEKLNFMQYETLPDIQQSLNEVEIQTLLEKQMKEAFTSLDDEEIRTPLEIEREETQTNIDDISSRIEQKEDRLSVSQVKFNQLKSNKDQGFVIDEVELQQLSDDITAIKDSINVERDNLNTANDERALAANKLLLERQNIPVTEENLMLLSEKLKEQQAATDVSKSINRLMLTGGM
tara:strand:+ start:975 stop:2210 length:1236 start_codon:yes stop_codon:yes gene_type:complete